MNINTKFEIGQTVYDKSNGDELCVAYITVEITKAGANPIYGCGSDKTSPLDYSEDELTTERPVPKSVYELEYGDYYWTIDYRGDVSRGVYDYECHEFLLALNDAIAHGNIFLSKEEAEKESVKRAIHQDLKRLSNYEYDMGGHNYSIVYFDILKIVVPVENNYALRPFEVYFPTYESALNAIEMIGEERLKRDYFGVV